MPALAQARDPLAAYARAAVIKGRTAPVPLIATQIGVKIDGGLAEVTTSRTFRNAEKDSIEATFTFPVPVDAALVELKAIIDGRTMVAQCQRRQKARETYEDAMDRGKTAVLHEEVLRGVHLISVGHIPPGKDITVIGTWAMTLGLGGHGGLLRIPTTVGEIYGRSPLPESDDLTTSDAVIHEADLEVECAHGTPFVLGQPLTGGKARVRLDAPIDISVPSISPRTFRTTTREGLLLSLHVGPAPLGEAELDADVLIDDSGSMTGSASGGWSGEPGMPSKHDMAVRGLADAAATLAAGDRVTLWTFSNYARCRWRGAGPGLGQAAAALGRPSAGATLIGESIDHVCAESTSRDILVITDGKSHAIDVQRAARHGRRITVVLIGEDALEATVGHLAALTQGQIFVGAGTDADAAIRRAIASMRTPSAPAPAINGQPERAEALLRGIRLEATWSQAAQSGEETGTVLVPSSDGLISARAIAGVAASLAVARMQEEEAAAFAETNGIVCHLTSLVLVDEEGGTQEGIPNQRKVDLMEPRVAMAAAAMPAMAAMNFAACAPSGGGVLRAAAFASAPPAAELAAAPRKRGALREGMSLRASGYGQEASAEATWGGGFVAPIGAGDPTWHHPLKPSTSDCARLPTSPGLLTPADIDRVVVGPGTVPPFVAFPPCAVVGDLAWVATQIEWAKNPNALLAGDLSAIGQDARISLVAASNGQGVLDLARELGTSQILAALAICAYLAGKDRAAMRIARGFTKGKGLSVFEAAATKMGLKAI